MMLLLLNKAMFLSNTKKKKKTLRKDSRQMTGLDVKLCPWEWERNRVGVWMRSRYVRWLHNFKSEKLSDLLTYILDTEQVWGEVVGLISDTSILNATKRSM